MIDLTEFGPFANVVFIACALVATFSLLLLKALGNVTRWTWLVSGSPSFLVTAGSRMVVVALMAITYVTIENSNSIWFGVGAVFFGLLGFWMVVRFEKLRRLHIAQIPMVGQNGRQLVDKGNNLIFKNIVIGLESQMEDHAKEALKQARKERGGVSLVKFMGGYGDGEMNDPETIWSRDILARINNSLTVTLMFIVLFGVMALFLAAFVIEVTQR